MNETSMIISGFTMLGLIFLLATFIAHKSIGLRVSGASVIASLFLSFPTSLGLIVLFPAENVSKWAVAAFMMCCVIAYLCWLWLFQPESLLQLTKKELKAKQLENYEINRKHILKQLKEARKNGSTQKLDLLKGELDALDNERKRVLQSYSRFKPIRTWFKKGEK